MALDRKSIGIGKKEKKKKKPNTRMKKLDLNSISVPLSNQFNSLDDAEDMEADKNDQINVKTESVSPVVITNHTIDINPVLTAIGIGYKLKIVSVGRKIFANSLDDKKKLIEALKEKQIPFFSHLDKENRVFKAVLSGLPEIDITIIDKQLKGDYQLDPIKTSMLNTNSTNKLYVVQFNKSDVSMRDLHEIKTVHHHIVKWLPFKKRNGPTQCLRCCMYGHGIQSCNRASICGLCSGNHLSTSCELFNKKTESTKSAFKCFNCASANIEHNHKANDINCPFRAKYIEARVNSRKKFRRVIKPTHDLPCSFPFRPPKDFQAPGSYWDKPIIQPRYFSTDHTEYVSYAKAAAKRINAQVPHTNENESSSSNTNESSSPNTNESSSSNTNDLFTFEEISNMLLNCITELQKCTSKFDQLRVIASLLQNACK